MAHGPKRSRLDNRVQFELSLKMGSLGRLVKVYGPRERAELDGLEARKSKVVDFELNTTVIKG